MIFSRLNPHCDSCKFYDPCKRKEYAFGNSDLDIHWKSIHGRCHRHPPISGGRPTIKADDWCAEHKIDWSDIDKANKFHEQEVRLDEEDLKKQKQRWEEEDKLKCQSQPEKLMDIE